MSSRYSFLVLDLATSSLPNVAEFIQLDDISAPDNYKDPEKIANYIAEKRADRIERAGLDIDLARLTSIGFKLWTDPIVVAILRTEDEERRQIKGLADLLHLWNPRFVTFGGHAFDLLLIQRRAAYLGVEFPYINTDRFKSNHVDLSDVLSHRGVTARKSLLWYVKRLGWTDLVKPLSGAEEAQVPQTGRWDDLRLSVRHDVEATYRLSKWLGIIPSEDTREPGIF